MKKKHNEIKILGEISIIYTKENFKIIIDTEDLCKVKNMYWRIGSKGYAICDKTINKKNIRIMMHRLIVNTPEGLYTDHINHNTLDNRKCNLRICNKSQNAMNATFNKKCKSKVRGVDYHIRDKAWRARITVYGKTLELGLFKNKNDAIKARKDAEILYFGDYAFNNTLGGIS